MHSNNNNPPSPGMRKGPGDDSSDADIPVSCRWRGPLFRVPVTVVRPEQLPLPDSAAEQAAGSGNTVTQPGPTGGLHFHRRTSSQPIHTTPSEYHCQRSAGEGGAGNGIGEPHAAYTFSTGPLNLNPGRELRRFLVVPTGASWAELQVRASARGPAVAAGTKQCCSGALGCPAGLWRCF